MTFQDKLPAANHKLTGIEAGRGIAAIIVVFYHAARHLKADYGSMPWHGFGQFGHAGVDFFFVLSGFIIYYVHKRDIGRPSALPGYFERRFTRIYPLFWVSLLIGLVFAGLSSTQTLPTIGELLQRATLLPFGGNVGVAWTLQHEILFYLIFALAIMQRSIGIVVFVTWFTGIAIALFLGYSPADSPLLYCLLSVFNVQFFLGMFAAYVVTTGQFRRHTFIFGAGIVGFGVLGILENIGAFNGYTNTSKLAYGMSSTLIVIGLAGANVSGQLQPPNALVHLGKASYSIYLLHLPCIGIIYKLLTISGLKAAMHVDLIYLVISVGSILMCMVASAYVEYPLIAAIRKGNAVVRRSMSPVAKSA